MEFFDEYILFKISIKLEISDLLNWCRCNKKIYRLIYNKDLIWDRNLHSYFTEKDFDILTLETKNNTFKFLYSLSILKKKLGMLKVYRFDNINTNFKTLTLKQLYEENLIICRYSKILQLPNGIGILKNLHMINMNENNISKFPSDFFQLKNLKWMSFAGNNIKEIPKEIVNLTNLQELDLSGNSIETIPIELCNVINLKNLSLGDNKIEKIPEDIYKLTKLEYLDLCHNKITFIPSQIGRLIKLKTFKMHNNPITEIPEELRFLINK